MASGRVMMLNVCRKCRIAFKCAAERVHIPRIGIRYPQKCLFVTTAVFGFHEAIQKLNLQAPDQERQKQEYVLKAASANAADSVTTLLSQTAFALIETEQRYRHMMTTLMQLLDLRVTLLDHGTEDEEKRVLGTIDEATCWIKAYQKHIQDLEKLLLSVRNLADVSADVAFQAGTEFTSTSLGERVHQMTLHTASARQERQKMEAQLREMQTSCSEAVTKHAERAEQKKKAEDAVFDGDLFEENEEEQEDRVDEQCHETAPKEECAKENTEKITYEV